MSRSQSLITYTTRNPHNEEYEEMFGSEFEFLEHQRISTEKDYKNWIKCFVAMNIGVLIYSIIFLTYWLYEIYLIGTNGINCEKIKGLMIFLVITYIIGMLAHIICFISAFLRSILGLVIYMILILAVFIMRINFDVGLIDLIIQNLKGCTEQNLPNTPKQYIVSSVGYCTVMLLLLAYTVKIIHLIGRVRKAKRLQMEHTTRIQKQISGYN